ncbi:MAG: DNA-formamidopyrimidine glycosylase [Patescibacteria group bacterium]
MPELPEVETIRRQLERIIVGKKIKSVEIIDFQKKIKPKNLSERLKDLKIERIDRRAKLLIIKLSSGENLLIHLKLTGQLIYQKIKKTNKFTHAIFNFTDSSRLLFNDMRKFGYLVLTDDGGLERVKKEYGVEPLSKEFSLTKFKQVLVNRPNQKIKQLLLDQKYIAGIGNIYSDEALFMAGILPLRPAKSLKEGEIKKLWPAIPAILKKSLKVGGTSSDTYVDAHGQIGGFVPHLKVYGREDEKCRRCGSLIKRIKIGGRSAHYCPRCQR